MRFLVPLLSTLPLLWATSTVLADETDFAGALLANKSLLTSPPPSCDAEKVPLNTFQLQQCAAVAFRAADRAMGVAFRKALQDTTAANHGKLLDAQRRWLSFRNLECDWESSRYEGGTFAPVVMGNCLVEITRARTSGLQKAEEP